MPEHIIVSDLFLQFTLFASLSAALCRDSTQQIGNLIKSRRADEMRDKGKKDTIFHIRE